MLARVSKDDLELWEVLTGATTVRTSPQDVTVFDSVGFSLEDFSTLNLVYELAQSEKRADSLRRLSLRPLGHRSAPPWPLYLNCMQLPLF